MIGPAILVLLGNGVVANVVPSGTKGEGGGWIVITWGWGMAVFVTVFTLAAFSGAYLNPAVTIGLAIASKFEWARVPSHILAQFIGAFIGSLLVWLFYRPHYAVTEDLDNKLATFCTAPEVRDKPAPLQPPAKKEPAPASATTPPDDRQSASPSAAEDAPELVRFPHLKGRDAGLWRRPAAQCSMRSCLVIQAN